MLEATSGLNIIVVYMWCSIDIFIIIVMSIVVTAQIIRSNSTFVTKFNVLLYCIFFGWILASITDALWFGYRLISLPVQDVLGYSGTALTLNGYVYLILARTNTISENVFPSFTKPLNYMSRFFLVVSLVPILLSFVDLFLSSHTHMIYLLDTISTFANILAGLLILIFDLTCVAMFLKLYGVVQTKNIQNSTFKLIGKWGLCSSACVLLATLFFAIHGVLNIPYTLFVSRTFGVFAGMFLLCMKMSLTYEERSPSMYTKDFLKSKEVEKSRERSKSINTKKEADLEVAR